MIILNYLLVFSILIISAVKTADVFKKANSQLHKEQKSFIQLTRDKHNTGSISLMGCFLTLMFSLLLLFFVLKFKVELQEARYRRDSYLCMHYLNITTENYILDMGKLNIALRTAFAVGIISGPAKAAFKALEVARDARHLYYLKQLIAYRFCSKEMSLHYLLNPPFKKKAGGVLVATNLDGTTLIRKNKWKMTIMKNPSGIRLKNSFCLESSWELSSAFFPDPVIKTREITNAGVSKLKCLSGLASFL